MTCERQIMNRVLVFAAVLVVLAACSAFNDVQRSYLEGAETVERSADADVIFVRAVQTGETLWTFHVTVEHPDTGWEDYADGWDVVLPDGTIARPDPASPFTRLLLHPHENEQPFTRSQSNIEIPTDVQMVTVRAHDIVDGFGGREVIVDLSQAEGDGYSVERL